MTPVRLGYGISIEHDTYFNLLVLTRLMGDGTTARIPLNEEQLNLINTFAALVPPLTGQRS